ncbi:putative eukaryotic translation initiation factor 3 subunit EifCj [Phyllosticta capitalensis]|uniref:Eukaryotic translation initiation factor 3 subunit J n=1 Tax=Phyllosticta capitalensis TaxID=121624 RepID=A0ABR1Z0R4_9PEZI
MPPSKWDDESEEDTPVAPVARRSKWDDEEEDDVLDSWDAEEDSEVEREKAKKAAEAKAKADAEAKANHKSKSKRIEDRIAENRRKKMDAEMDYESEDDEATKRAKARKNEMDADLAAAEDLFGEMSVGERQAPSKPNDDLFGDAGLGKKRAGTKAVTVTDKADPTKTVELSSLSLFSPSTKDDFHKLRETLVPLLVANSKKPQYAIFLQEFSKQIAKELPSDQIKKIASGMTTLSNEKLKEEKAAEKGGKKSKAAKTKVNLNASRDVAYKPDTATYDDDFGE